MYLRTGYLYNEIDFKVVVYRNFNSGIVFMMSVIVMQLNHIYTAI